VTAVKVDADPLLIGTVLVKPPAATFTPATLDPVVQQHSVAYFKIGLSIGADGHNLARYVTPQYAG
jgi:hypothetical protein